MTATDPAVLPTNAESTAADRAHVFHSWSAQELIAPLGQPFKDYADMQVCFGNVAPHGMVFKVSSMQSPRFTGRAICFSDARAVSDAAAAGLIRPGHFVVLRGLGPVAAGMPEVLTEMRRHVENFGILTSNAPANVDVFLRAHGLRELFEFISSTSKLTGKAKHLRAIRKTFSLRHEEMLYIGDELRDVKASQKAGVPVAAVTWGFNSRESLAAENPDYLFDHPEDFLRLLAPR